MNNLPVKEYDVIQYNAALDMFFYGREVKPSSSAINSRRHGFSSLGNLNQITLII